MTASLIKALEEAEGPSRELDARIAIAVRSTDALNFQELPSWASDKFPTWRARPDGRVECVHSDGTGGMNWWPLTYTASIDAALTLVPEGAEHWSLASDNEAFVSVYGVDEHDGRGATPALALCIAALRAREEVER